MGKPKHTKESIVETLRNVAASLGKGTLSKQEVQQYLPESSIRYHFGSFGNALDAAGLTVNRQPPQQVRLSDDELFGSVLEVESSVGREPTEGDYSANGRYSCKPFRKRYGKWSDTLAYYRKWKSQRTRASAADVSLVTSTPAVPDERLVMPANDAQYQLPSAVLQLYGEPISFRGLRHAPINEQGVVYVFGMVSRELGFSVESLQQAFPDCEAKYLHDAKRGLWARARIEFEYKSSSFREHGHDAKQCNFVVCWEDDWPECPIRVIELRKEILKLPSG